MHADRLLLQYICPERNQANQLSGSEIIDSLAYRVSAAPNQKESGNACPLVIGFPEFRAVVSEFPYFSKETILEI